MLSMYDCGHLSQPESYSDIIVQLGVFPCHFATLHLFSDRDVLGSPYFYRNHNKM